MERWMIVYLLPLEVWMDIFCFPRISREEFGQLVDKIGNWKFAEHAQFFLHEWGKRKLGNLHFDKSGLRKYVIGYGEDGPHRKSVRLDFPQIPMPENIKSFASINIRHFDARTMDFLGRIESLLTDVGIDAWNLSTKYLDNLRTILTNLEPLLDGIHTLGCNQRTLPLAMQCFPRENMAKLNCLFHFDDDNTMDGAMARENVNTIVHWLTQPAADGPKLCAVSFSQYVFSQQCQKGIFEQFSKQLVKAIREHFLAAKIPLTYAVQIRCFYLQFAEFHLENGIGQELHGVPTGGFQITRHRANGNTEEVRQWIMEESNRRSSSCIQISYPTIGSLDAAQMDGTRVEVEEVQQQQPCSSKDV